MRRPLTLSCLFAAVAVLAAATAQTSAMHRLRVHSGDRMLIKSNGTPFFWMADTNWRLFKLTQSQVGTYMEDRKDKGFTVIQGPVLLHSDVNSETTNAYGDFNDSATNPDGQWFNHIDYIVNKAQSKGLYIALVAVWGSDWEMFGSNNSQRVARARQYGRWLGNRYRNENHVIWIVAGEYTIEGDSSAILNVWESLARGLRDGCDGRHLITVHGNYEAGQQSSSVEFHDEPWLDFNMIHSGQSGDNGSGANNYALVRADWTKNPDKPTVDGEANYEGLGGWDSFGVRRRAYWSVFAGAFGHTYGANGVWGSYRGGNDDVEGAPEHLWNVAIDYAGAFDMKHLRNLMESRPMLNRKPAGDFLISAGGNVPERMEATRDRNGKYAMVYVPDSNRSFTVDMDLIAGSQARAWWFNPRNGSATLIGNYPTSGSRTFTTPNSGADWVLVVDDRARGYPRPGVGGPLR